MILHESEGKGWCSKGKGKYDGTGGNRAMPAAFVSRGRQQHKYGLGTVFWFSGSLVENM